MFCFLFRSINWYSIKLPSQLKCLRKKNYNKRIRVLNAVVEQLCSSAAQVLTKQPTSQNKARIFMNFMLQYLLQIKPLCSTIAKKTLFICWSQCRWDCQNRFQFHLQSTNQIILNLTKKLSLFCIRNINYIMNLCYIWSFKEIIKYRNM